MMFKLIILTTVLIVSSGHIVVIGGEQFSCSSSSNTTPVNFFYKKIVSRLDYLDSVNMKDLSWTIACYVDTYKHVKIRLLPVCRETDLATCKDNLENLRERCTEHDLQHYVEYSLLAENLIRKLYPCQDNSNTSTPIRFQELNRSQRYRITRGRKIAISLLEPTEEGTKKWTRVGTITWFSNGTSSNLLDCELEVGDVSSYFDVGQIISIAGVIAKVNLDKHKRILNEALVKARNSYGEKSQLREIFCHPWDHVDNLVAFFLIAAASLMTIVYLVFSKKGRHPRPPYNSSAVTLI